MEVFYENTIHELETYSIVFFPTQQVPSGNGRERQNV